MAMAMNMYLGVWFYIFRNSNYGWF